VTFLSGGREQPLLRNRILKNSKVATYDLQPEGAFELTEALFQKIWKVRFGFCLNFA
jgi:bisphosphoglycerate-independent phosphoglycerate mutase (AlkP superfamily)